MKKEEKSKYTKCKICNIITPKNLNAIHCYYCDVCVIDHDHHCTCFGKCVGKNNCCTFYTSLVTIPLYMPKRTEGPKTQFALPGAPRAAESEMSAFTKIRKAATEREWCPGRSSAEAA